MGAPYADHCRFGGHLGMIDTQGLPPGPFGLASIKSINQAEI
jgi:hypothetical protein